MVFGVSYRVVGGTGSGLMNCQHTSIHTSGLDNAEAQSIKCHPLRPSVSLCMQSRLVTWQPMAVSINCGCFLLVSF